MKQLLWILFSKVSLFYLTDIGYVIQDMIWKQALIWNIQDMIWKQACIWNIQDMIWKQALIRMFQSNKTQ